jgi:hypothetical protein
LFESEHILYGTPLLPAKRRNNAPPSLSPAAICAVKPIFLLVFEGCADVDDGKINTQITLCTRAQSSGKLLSAENNISYRIERKTIMTSLLTKIIASLFGFIITFGMMVVISSGLSGLA